MSLLLVIAQLAAVLDLTFLGQSQNLVMERGTADKAELTPATYLQEFSPSPCLTRV